MRARDELRRGLAILNDTQNARRLSNKLRRSEQKVAMSPEPDSMQVITQRKAYMTCYRTRVSEPRLFRTIISLDIREESVPVWVLLVRWEDQTFIQLCSAMIIYLSWAQPFQCHWWRLRMSLVCSLICSIAQRMLVLAVKLIFHRNSKVHNSTYPSRWP